MKRISGCILFLLFISAVSICSEPAKITVYYWERFPYFGKIDGHVKGILVGIVEMVFEEAGIEYEYLEVPPKRALESLKNNGNLCSLGWFRTSEREKQYLFSDTYIYQDEPFSIIVRKSNTNVFSNRTSMPVKEVLESGFQMGVIDGYLYGNWLDSMIEMYGPKVQKVNIGENSEIMYRMLAAGRFDYMFAGLEESRYVLNSHPEYGKSLRIIEISDAPGGNFRYMMFNKGIDRSILKKINNAVLSVKSSQKYFDTIDRFSSAKKYQ